MVHLARLSAVLFPAAAQTVTQPGRLSVVRVLAGDVAAMAALSVLHGAGTHHLASITIGSLLCTPAKT